MRFTPILIALCLTACPEAPQDLPGGENEGAGAPATPSGQVGSPGTPSAAAPSIDATMDEPKHSQSDLKDSPDAIKIAGVIRCEDGDGPFRVRVFVPPPSEGGPEQETDGSPPGPLAAESFDETGPFEMYTPKGAALKLLAYEDMDENGVPTPEETQFGTVGGDNLDLSQSRTDIVLDCSASAPVPDPIPAKIGDESSSGPAAPPDEAVPPADGPAAEPTEGGPVGPPPEGAPVGPPPEGAPVGPPPEGAPAGPPPEEG